MKVKDYTIKTYPSNFTIRLDGEEDGEYMYHRIDIDGLEVEDETEAKFNASADIDEIESYGITIPQDIKENLRNDLEFLYLLYLKK